MTACQVDPVACPPNRRTFNPDGTRIRDQTPEEKAAEEKVFAEGRKRWGDRWADNLLVSRTLFFLVVFLVTGLDFFSLRGFCAAMVIAACVHLWPGIVFWERVGGREVASEGVGNRNENGNGNGNGTIIIVGRRPTPPPADQTTKTTSTTSNAETTSIGSDATLLPGQDGKAEGKRKGGLLARVFHRDKKEGEKEKRMDQYIAAAASWGGDEDVGGKGKGEGVRRERLGRRD